MKEECKHIIKGKQKNQTIYISGLLACMVCIFVQCSSGIYYSGFKTTKKNIDTLAIIRPYIFVKSIKDQKQFEDYALSTKLEKQIHEKSKSILSSKYTLTDISAMSDTISEKDLFVFFQSIDLKNQKSEIKTPHFIQNVLKNVPERYCLMIFFNGYYNSYFEPYHDINMGLQRNSIYVSLKDLYGSDMRLLVIDNLKSKLVYHSKQKASNKDPRIPDMI